MIPMRQSAASLRHTILAALGAAGATSPACTGVGPSGSAAPVEVNVAPAAPPPASATRGESAPRPRGYVREKDGTIHRTGPVMCDPAIGEPACRGDEGHLYCKSDADCKDRPYGKCVSGSGQIGDYCGCTYACRTDADCADTEACVCAGQVPISAGHSICAPARCKADAECGSEACGVSIYNDGCGENVSLACRTPEDSCRTNADCKAESGEDAWRGASQCAAGEDGWTCRGMGCVIGRPLLVGGEARTAPGRARSDWSRGGGAGAEDSGGLGESRSDAIWGAISGALAERWGEAAALEHASIASFARFSLQLLALGAPADLLEASSRAALDEIEHARLAYGLARRFGGRDVGPGPLPEALAPLAAEPLAVVRALVVEGCLGETAGALEARVLAAAAEDAELEAVFARLAEDEGRHAALAWRTLAWMLEAFGPPARAAAEEALATAAAAFSVDPSPRGPVAPSLGLLAPAETGAIRRSALRDVILPCAAALGLAGSPIAASEGPALA